MQRHVKLYHPQEPDVSRDQQHRSGANQVSQLPGLVEEHTKSSEDQTPIIGAATIATAPQALFPVLADQNNISRHDPTAISSQNLRSQFSFDGLQTASTQLETVPLMTPYRPSSHNDQLRQPSSASPADIQGGIHSAHTEDVFDVMGGPCCPSNLMMNSRPLTCNRNILHGESPISQ